MLALYFFVFMYSSLNAAIGVEKLAVVTNTKSNDFDAYVLPSIPITIVKHFVQAMTLAHKTVGFGNMAFVGGVVYLANQWYQGKYSSDLCKKLKLIRSRLDSLLLQKPFSLIKDDFNFENYNHLRKKSGDTKWEEFNRSMNDLGDYGIALEQINKAKTKLIKIKEDYNEIAGITHLDNLNDLDNIANSSELKKFLNLNENQLINILELNSWLSWDSWTAPKCVVSNQNGSTTYYLMILGVSLGMEIEFYQELLEKLREDYKKYFRLKELDSDTQLIANQDDSDEYVLPTTSSKSMSAGVSSRR